MADWSDSKTHLDLLIIAILVVMPFAIPFAGMESTGGIIGGIITTVALLLGIRTQV